MAIRNITVREAHAAQADGATYVDVRSVPEYEQGHPDGAVNVPLLHRDPQSGQMSPNPDFLTVMQRSFGADAPLLLGCQAGVRSAQAAQFLAAAGFTNLANVSGGFGGGHDPRTGAFTEGWAQANLPVASGAPEGRSYRALRERAARTP